MRLPARLLALPLALLAVAPTACANDAPPAASSPPARAETAAAAREAAQPGGARAAATIRLARVGSFESPVHVTQPAGERRRLWVVERGGTVRILDGRRKLARPFLDLSRETGTQGECGMLSLAFSPDYARSGRFYVYDSAKDCTTRVFEYRRSARNCNVADPRSRRLVLSQAQPEVNHNGGLLLFGPDRRLYIGLGDGGGRDDQHGARGNAQNLGSLLGKILRIDPLAAGGRPYTVPRDNPFVGRPGARGEIYAYGLRNPWRFSFDRRTQDLTIGDVGQDKVEEIDFVTRGRGRGANFGWRPLEGNNRVYPGESAPGAVGPAVTHTHAQGYCSITGGVVVRDRSLTGLYGRYVYGDLCNASVHAALLRPGRAARTRVTSLKVPSLVSFGEDSTGRVYAVSIEGGVYRLTR